MNAVRHKWTFGLRSILIAITAISIALAISASPRIRLGYWYLMIVDSDGFKTHMIGQP